MVAAVGPGSSCGFSGRMDSLVGAAGAGAVGAGFAETAAACSASAGSAGASAPLTAAGVASWLVAVAASLVDLAFRSPEDVSAEPADAIIYKKKGQFIRQNKHLS